MRAKCQFSSETTHVVQDTIGSLCKFARASGSLKEVLPVSDLVNGGDPPKTHATDGTNLLTPIYFWGALPCSRPLEFRNKHRVEARMIEKDGTGLVRESSSQAS